MSKKRYIDSKFWSDPWVVDELNPLDCYLYMYLLTNEHTTIAGVYEISLRSMAFEVKIDQEEITRMLKRLEPKVYYIEGWIILRNGVKNQNYRNEKIDKGIRLVFDKCPDFVLEYITLPKDFKYQRSATLHDDSSMSHDDLLHHDSDSDSDSDLDLDAGLQGFKKTIKTKKQKYNYVKAVRADEALASREKTSRTRAPTPDTAIDVNSLFGGSK